MSINTYAPCTQRLFRYTSSPGPGSLSLFFYVHSVYLTPSFSNINHQYISHSTVLYFVYKHSQYSCLHSHKERESSGHDWPPSDRRCPQSRLDTCRWSHQKGSACILDLTQCLVNASGIQLCSVWTVIIWNDVIIYSWMHMNTCTYSSNTRTYWNEVIDNGMKLWQVYIGMQPWQIDIGMRLWWIDPSLWCS